MTEEEVKRDEEKRKARLAEIAKMSDGYLKQLASDTQQEFFMLREELEKREHAKLHVVVAIDHLTTLREIEDAIHAYGDHKGFDGTVLIERLSTGGYGILVKEG